MLKIGDIWTDVCWYKREEDGRCMQKHFAILALGGDDVTIRLLTSKSAGRSKAPRCYHGPPYASFYLGVIEPGSVDLGKESWLDLRYANDIDDRDFVKLFSSGDVFRLGAIPDPLLCDALLCVATAPATRPLQSKRIYSSRHALGCR